jgi:uncharacterized damage-inducible protein DinB
MADRDRGELLAQDHMAATRDTGNWEKIVASALDWEEAHAGFDSAIAKLPPDLRGRRPDRFPHSVWELVDHIRRTQHDLLDFCLNPAYQAPEWPRDYWPATPAPARDADWDECIAAYREDNAALAAFTSDGSRDLTAKIPHGTGQTYLRTVLVAIDHTSHHVGQIIAVRRLLGAWPPAR